MKQVGLLTFHDTTNFGSWLQTFALYTKVKQLGYTIEVIDYKCKGIELREKMTPERIRTSSIESIVLQIKKQIVFYVYSKRYLKISKKKYTRENISTVQKKYKLYLLGSDLVWDLNITYNDTTYMFDFLDADAVRCAYAASSGRESIPFSQRDIFKKYLKNFNEISVRESGMVKDIGDLLKIKVNHVCDPTWLLEFDEWKGLIKKKTIKEKYVLLYFIDGRGNLSRLAKKYAKKNGLKILAINRDYNIDLKDEINPVSVKEFLSLIFYAEKIFTASYHGMMFSMLFNKQFAFYPFAPATRMQSVANMFGLEKMNIESPEFDLEAKINYSSVNKKMMEFRAESIKTLEEMLKI